MNKKEVQKRVLYKGSPVPMKDFEWNEKTKTFSSILEDLVLDFNNISGCTFDTGYGCTFNTGSGCTFDTGSSCTFNTGSGCTFDTGYGCTFNTGSSCTFNTGFNCTFKTDSNCTFNTGSSCTFDTGYGCTFDTGFNCVVVRRDVFEVVVNVKTLTLAPYEIPGYVSEGIYSVTNKPAIIADGILSNVLSKKVSKGYTIYKVVNYRETKESYLIEKDQVFSHGKTLKEAKESFIYKIKTGSRDTSVYDNFTLDTKINLEEAIKMYRIITGACKEGAKYFVKTLGQEKIPKDLTVRKVIEITQGQYNHETLVKFFENKSR